MELQKADIGKNIQWLGKDHLGYPEMKIETLRSFHRWDSGVVTFCSDNGERIITGVSSEIIQILAI
jgi:hypothetical protein